MTEIKTDAQRGRLFVAPGVIITALIILFPTVYVIYLSFMDSSNDFVGLNNYINIFNSHHFGQIILNTTIWTVGSVLVAFILGLITAMILNQKSIKAKGVWMTLLLLAWITPGVVRAVVWKWVYGSEFGILNHMLQSMGIINHSISWLSDPNLALLSVMIVQIWATFPVVVLMTNAGLQSISNDLYEAADLDGANVFQRFYYITFPLLKNINFISLLLLIIWAINEFTLIWVLTQGGPSGSTEILSLSIYHDFQSFDINSASATSVILLFVSLIFAIWYIRKINKED